MVTDHHTLILEDAAGRRLVSFPSDDEAGCLTLGAHPTAQLTVEQVQTLLGHLTRWLADQLPTDELADVLPDLTRDGYAWPTQAQSILQEAHDAVYGDREDDYGHPRGNLTRTAVVWTGLLQHKLADGEYVSPEDVARLNLGQKLSRDVHGGKRDNRVDMAGFALLLDRLETGQ